MTQEVGREPLRAGDADRDVVLERLAAAAAEGRLTPEEHAERVARVMAPTTTADLARLVSDLPVSGSEQRARDLEQQRRDLREWLQEWRYWLGGAAILLTIWAVQSVRAGEPERFWPLLPLAVWAAILVAYGIWGADSDRRDD